MQEIQANALKYYDNIWEKITWQDDVSPEPRSGHASVMFQSRSLFIFGGYNDREALNDMYKFDMERSIWQKIEYLTKENEIPSSKRS